ncbi:Shikimate kinase 2 [Candidatus Entotheonellaceae bacterium PAL068K]
MNVILTGMRGTGKSSIGRVLADLLGFAFVDIDTVIEVRAGSRVAEIVAQHGWEHFRALERRAVADIAASDRQVIASGGGTLIDEDNAACLKVHGIVILLLCDVATLQRRIGAGTNRPSLTGQASAMGELEQVWQARRERYHTVADLTSDVSVESTSSEPDVQQKAQAICALLHRHTAFHQIKKTY